MRSICGFKLHNSKLHAFQEFLGVFNPKWHDLADLKKSSCVLSLGSRLKNENPLLKYALANALKVNKGTSLIYAHPLEDSALEKICRSVVPVCHAVGAEEIILGAFLMALGVDSPSLQSLKDSQITQEPEPKPTQEAPKQAQNQPPSTKIKSMPVA